MAPEQLRGLPVDHRTDLYALGCIMFELYSGRPPFSGRTEDVLAAHLTMEPPALTGITGLSPKLATVIQRLLTKNRDQRIQSAVELVQTIDAATGFRYRTSKLEPLLDDAPPLPATLLPYASTRMPRLPERRASLLLSALVFAAGARGLLLEVETPPRSPAVVRAAVPTRSQSPQNPPSVPVRVELPASAAEPAPRPPAAAPAVTTANLVEMYAEVGQQLKALRHDRGAGATADLWPPYLSIRINEAIADPARREATSALLRRLREQLVERSR
jgi:serine/threonine protein kinase